MSYITLDKFDQNDAWILGNLMREKAVERKYPIAIDIRRGDTPLFSVMLEGASRLNFDWARRKRNLTVLTEESSWFYSEKLAEGKNIIELMGLNPRDFTTHGGCEPIFVAGVGLVATVTISGLPQKEDHDFAVECLEEFAKQQARG